MSAESYGLGERSGEGGDSPQIPSLDYRPPNIAQPVPGVGLVGCGGISEYHLAAYRRMGLPVLALANPTVEKARERAREFFPEAAVYRDHEELLEHPGIQIVDVATHPEVRGPILEAALEAGKHVLSQKPFVLDLNQGEHLVRLAREHGLKLAVNQNGRWAPHLAAMREAVVTGVTGPLASVDISIHWDHSWTVGTAFDRTPFLVLFDFGVHWFDFVASLFPGENARSVYASVGRTPTQSSPQPMLAQVVIEYGSARVTLKLNGDSTAWQRDLTVVSGCDGTLVSEGPDLQSQDLTLHTRAGSTPIPLEGDWFSVGFEGTMAELLCAVEQGREPANGARENLRSLALAFAACESARRGAPVEPGSVRALPEP